MNAWISRHAVTLLRLSLGLVFLWFGILKFFPGSGEAERLAARTMAWLTFGRMTPAVSVPFLAAWESLIGLGLLSGFALRLTLIVLFAHLLGTMLPLFIFPQETFKVFPWIPNLDGQYILKNIILISAGLVLWKDQRK
jgi:uncharacterized membrane protein YkgB